MDIKNILADASAPLLERINAALEELRAARQAAIDAGFSVSLRANAGEVSAHEAAMFGTALPFVSNRLVFPVLEYRATIQERQEG